MARRTVLNFEHAEHWTLSSAVTDSEVRFSTDSVNANWDLFKEIIHIGISKYIPKKLSRSSSEPIWYSTEIRRTLRLQRILRNRMRKSSSESLKHKFKCLCNKLKKLLTNACNHFKQFTLGQSLKENPKFFWKYVKSLGKSPNKIVSVKF